MGEPIRRSSIGSSQTSLFRSSDAPLILSESGGGSCARSSVIVGGTHVSNGGGCTPPNAAIGELRRSAYTGCPKSPWTIGYFVR